MGTKAKFNILCRYKKEENIEDAISLYKEISQDFPESEYSPVAIMAIADIYDNLLGNLDSTLISYEKLINNYPESPQTQFVKTRYNQLMELKQTYLKLIQSN